MFEVTCMIKSITNFLIIFFVFQQLKSQISQIDQNGYNPFCDETLHKYIFLANLPARGHIDWWVHWWAIHSQQDPSSPGGRQHCLLHHRCLQSHDRRLEKIIIQSKMHYAQNWEKFEGWGWFNLTWGSQVLVEGGLFLNSVFVREEVFTCTTLYFKIYPQVFNGICLACFWTNVVLHMYTALEKCGYTCNIDINL